MDKFKDSKGRWRTQSLFLEAAYDSDAAIYTMKETDHPSGLPSFRRLYLEIADPTEYRQASELVGGWAHWQALNQSRWFDEFITPIREELEIKLRSEALLAAYMIIGSGKQGELQAAKFFAEGKYKPSRGRGRPSKADIESEVRKQAAINSRIRGDMERLGLTVIEGNEE